MAKSNIDALEKSYIDSFEELYDRTTGGWRIPHHWSETLDADKFEGWKANQPNNWAPVEKEVGEFYRAIIALTGPHKVLETGTNRGYSAFCIAQALARLGGDRSLTTIDVGSADHLFDHSEIGRLVTFVCANSLEIPLERLSRDGLARPTFDMLFLDSDHSYRTIAGEIVRFAPLLEVGGLIILHDTFYFDGIALVVQQLKKQPEFELVNMPTPRSHGQEGHRCPGLTIIRKIAPVADHFMLLDDALMDVEVNLPGRHITDAPLV